tara:strand:- start:10408 stop:11448 length:1041 start_codon:yes stop_codon:yes gene_type:complete
MITNKRIFHLAGFDLTSYSLSFYSCDRKISDGLIKNNNIVKEFSYNDIIRMNSLIKSRKFFKNKGHEILFSTIKNFQPEIILIGHVNLSDEVMKKIKSLCPKAKIASWYVDPPELDRMNRYNILQKYIDILFMTSGGNTIKVLKESFKDLPKIAFFPNPTDSSIDFHKSFLEENHKYDVMYCGSDKRYSNRRSFLEKVIELTPKLNWFIAGSLGKPKVFGAEYYKVLSQTKFAINISKFSPNTYDFYSSDRISQLTGNGLLTFNQDFPSISKLFNENEIIIFNEPEELAEKLNYYHENKDIAKEIAQAGFKKAHFSYSSERIAKFMLEAIYNKDFSENYEWKNEIY